MSALIIDTSSWVSYLAGRGPFAFVEDALAESRVYLPAIVAAELCSGNLTPKKDADLRDLLADLPLCDASLSHWLEVGHLRQRLRRRGLTISTPDAHVAQCALQLGAALLTEDGVFAKIAKHEPLVLA